MSSSCDCNGDDYKGCLKQSNNLYVCYKKDGSIDTTKSCSGQKTTDDNANEGWTKGCGTLTYQDLKTRMTKWCTKLYQDGIYDHNQYQDCLSNLDTGTVDYYKKDISSGVDDNKDVSRIYGYYQKGREKVNNTNPNIPIVEDDLGKVSLYHTKQKGYLMSDENGNLSVDINSENNNDKDWQLINLGKDQIYGLKSNYGKFLNGTDKNTLETVSDNLSSWGQWKLIKQNETFAFQSVAHNKYLTMNGDELSMKQGWSDNNLWVLKKKQDISGSYLKSFDKSGLSKKKDELVNLMDNSYRKAVDNKFKRDYYKNKILQLKYLRDQQKEYLLQTVFNSENQLNDNKEQLMIEIEKLRKFIDQPAETNKITYDLLVSQYNTECDMSESCVNSALEYTSNTLPTGSPNDDARLQKIKNRQNECKWSDKQTLDIINNSFQLPTDDYCTDLNNQKETLSELLTKNQSDYNNLIDEKNKIIKNINYQLLDLDIFKNEIKDQFNELNDNENKKITLIFKNAEKERADNVKKFRIAEKNVDNYISSLEKSNRIIENKISGITDEIDTQLTENNKLELNIETNKLLINTKNTSEIIKSNHIILLSKLSKTKTLFYMGIIAIIIILCFIIYLSYKIYYKIKNRKR